MYETWLRIQQATAKKEAADALQEQYHEELWKVLLAIYKDRSVRETQFQVPRRRGLTTAAVIAICHFLMENPGRGALFVCDRFGVCVADRLLRSYDMTNRVDIMRDTVPFVNYDLIVVDDAYTRTPNVIESLRPRGAKLVLLYH